MVLGLGVHDALAGDQLGGGWITRLEGHFHRLHQRLADVADDFASRRLGLRVETASLESVYFDVLGISAPTNGVPS